MPYNKGDFTQQGVAGDVSALVRLNEKRVMKVVLSSDDESDNCDISGAVYDLLNEEVYPIGAGVSGNIEITENGENINVAPYATATVNVSGGGGDVTETYYFVYSDEYEVEEGEVGFGDVYLYGNIIPDMPDTFTLVIENNTVTFNKVAVDSYTSTDNKYTLNITSDEVIMTVSLSDYPLGTYIEIGDSTITLTGHPNYLLIPAGTIVPIIVTGNIDTVFYSFYKNNSGDSDIIFTVLSDYLILGR